MQTNVKPTFIAFYLPQFYPTPENDKWFGKGFTEWTLVGNAKPLFKGHYQPRVPSDLGYYDLRMPEVRIAQAELAKEAGITAFCYYHYWFGNGKRMLEMPLNEVVKTQEPDFPFCITWANHNWYKKNWDPTKSELHKIPILKQEYPGLTDIDDHFYALLNVFKDKRYYKIKGRLVFVFYRIEDIPYLDTFQRRWQQLAEDNGLPGFYFISYVDDQYRLQHPSHLTCEASILSLKTELDSFGKKPIVRKASRFLQALLSQALSRPTNVHEYKDILPRLVNPLCKENRIYPVVIPNWDHTPRRGCGSLIFHNATPDLFKKHVKQTLELIQDKPQEDRIVFIKSWNEWGEGNYMEPDLKYGKGYIRALYEVLNCCQR